MIKRKKSCASILTDEGFSYIETLFSLSVISLIAFILPGVFSVFTQLDMVDTNLDGDIFTMDIIEVSEAAKEAATDGRYIVAFEMDNERVEYRYNNSRVIKSIDGKGFITMMFDVVSWEVTDHEDRIIIKIKTNGEFNETLIIGK